MMAEVYASVKSANVPFWQYETKNLEKVKGFGS